MEKKTVEDQKVGASLQSKAERSTSTRVVRIRRKRDGPILQDCDVYVGRSNTQGGWNLKTSKWHNPYKVWSNEEAVSKYRAYIQSNKDLMACLHELKGKTLGCWCKPLPCHGDVLAELANQIQSDDEK